MPRLMLEILIVGGLVIAAYAYWVLTQSWGFVGLWLIVLLARAMDAKRQRRQRGT